LIKALIKERILIIVILLSAFFGNSFLFAESSIDHAVLVSITTDSLPTPRITLHFPYDTAALEYTISRKFKQDNDWRDTLAILPGSDSIFTDSTITIGIGYEYKLKKKLKDYDAFFYAYAGIKLPETDDRGIALLLVDSTMNIPLDSELTVFESDLRGDGWRVIREIAPRTEQYNSSAVQRTKIIIKDEYIRNDSDIKAIILFGRIAVPYSGNSALDGHVPDHKGAWVADLYYGELDGIWTDYLVNNTEATRPENKNVPGDGKFDQIVIPSDVDIPVGRIDFFNLPGMSASETELLRQYLNKEHGYRQGIITANDKGLITDGFWMYDNEAFASEAWMNFSALLGPINVDSGNYHDGLTGKSYKWSYGCNSGGYNSVYATAYVPDFNKDLFNGIFTVLFGSYLGDWDSQDNIMRVAIASKPSILTCCWASRPFWYFHHMGLGETIGYSTLLSQNNQYLYESSGVLGYRMTHTALMGDPTLREHVVAPPSNLEILSTTINQNSASIDMKWETSPDTNVIGYNVFWASDYNNKFFKVNPSLVTDTEFTDRLPAPGRNLYMVRAVKLEQTPTGSYYNQSEGIFKETDLPKINFSSLTAPIMNFYPNPVFERLYIAFLQQISTRFELAIYDMSGRLIRIIGAGRIPPGRYLYTWDLKDINYAKVATGIYFVRYLTTEGITTLKVYVK
jgi:hypothetical protein